jgi:peptide chain release factor
VKQQKANKMKTNKKILQITAGRGPKECAFVVAKVLKAFLKELAPELIEYTIVNTIPGMENGTIQSVTVQLEGKDIEQFLKSWIGTILWIGQSTFRKNQKRKNWFIAIFEITNKVLLEINEKDFKYQTMRSSGAGGQHVNKVSSAVRATHPFTEISVTVMDTRSQHQNKKIAITRLTEKLHTYQLEKLAKDVKNEWQNHLNIQRGNPVRIFKGSDFKKNKKVKTFKKQRNALKNDLRKLIK